MSLWISDEVLDRLEMTEGELRAEIAVMLLQREKLTVDEASRLARMPRAGFHHLMASRGISTPSTAGGPA